MHIFIYMCMCMCVSLCLLWGAVSRRVSSVVARYLLFVIRDWSFVVGCPSLCCALLSAQTNQHTHTQTPRQCRETKQGDTRRVQIFAKQTLGTEGHPTSRDRWASEKQIKSSALLPQGLVNCIECVNKPSENHKNQKQEKPMISLD